MCDRPELKSSLQKYWIYFTVAYASYKALQALNGFGKLTSKEHEIAKDASKLQAPKQHISPQFFLNPKGLWIYHRDWILPQDMTNLGYKEPKGVVIICHGLAEHIQRYENFAQVLNQSGYAVYGIDHQGHGMSDGDRCYVENFDDYVNDILLFSKRIKMEYKSQKNCKLFLFGHSMGGLIAAMAAYKADTQMTNNNNNNKNNNNNDDNKNNNNNENKSDTESSSNDSSNNSTNNNNNNNFDGNLFDGGIILSSPALGVAPEQDLPSAVKSVAWNIAKMVPKMGLLDLNNDGLSHEPTILYHLFKDPLHYKGKIPIQTAKELITTMEKMTNICKNGEIKYPFLIFGGTKDTLCYPPSWKVFYDNASSKDKTYQIFNGLYHETLNETENEQRKAINTVLDWIKKRSDE